MTGYNAAADLVGRNLAAGRGAKTAVIDSRGAHSYADIDAAASRFAHALALLDIRREERILLCLNDTADFHTCFLGAIKAGVVPVPVNTRLTRDDYAFMLRDSRAQTAFVSANLTPVFEGLHDRVIRDGDMLAYLIANQSADFRAADTVEDEMCFWLYTSGTTGQPKGAVHLHGDMARTAELYAGPTLGRNRGRRAVLRGETVLRLRPRQRPDIPDGGRRHSRAARRTARTGSPSAVCCARRGPRSSSACPRSSPCCWRAARRRGRANMG